MRSRRGSVYADAGIWAWLRRTRRHDVLDRALKRHPQRRFQLNTFAFPLAAHVRQMLRLAGVDRQIFRTGVFADDHTGINFFLRANEEPPALLNVVERVGRATPAPSTPSRRGRALQSRP